MNLLERFPKYTPSADILQYMYAEVDKLKVDKEATVKNLVILGVGTHLEIWSEEGYAEKCNALDREKMRKDMIQLKL